MSHLVTIKTPRQHGSIAAWPAVTEWKNLTEKNRRLLSNSNLVFQGRSLSHWRIQVQREIAKNIGTAWPVADSEAHESRPWIVTGHQPEAFHPGVLAKTLAASILANHMDGIPLNIVADHDILKSTRVPVLSGTSEHPVLANIAFDSGPTNIPFEERLIANLEQFSVFSEHVRGALGSYCFVPSICHAWEHAANAAQRGMSLPVAMATARMSIERRLGAVVHDTSTSALSETSAFTVFFRTIAREAPRWREVHNSSLHEHRRVHRMRSRNHPVPELGRQQSFTETSFWAWHPNDQRRRQLFVKTEKGEILLRAGDTLIGSVNVDGSEPLLSLGGWKIRPRALTATLFFRLFIADLFIHGIGGAKYDELLDVIAHRFFHEAIPSFAAITATLLLPVNSPGESNVAKMVRSRRDLIWNPERYLPASIADQEPLSHLIERKSELIAEIPSDSARRRQRYAEFRQINKLMAAYLEPLIHKAEIEIDAVMASKRRRAILQMRDYPFLVHPMESLSDLYQRLHQEFSPIRAAALS